MSTDISSSIRRKPGPRQQLTRRSCSDILFTALNCYSCVPASIAGLYRQTSPSLCTAELPVPEPTGYVCSAAAAYIRWWLHCPRYLSRQLWASCSPSGISCRLCAIRPACSRCSSCAATYSVPTARIRILHLNVFATGCPPRAPQGFFAPATHPVPLLRPITIARRG